MLVLWGSGASLGVLLELLLVHEGPLENTLGSFGVFLRVLKSALGSFEVFLGVHGGALGSFGLL